MVRARVVAACQWNISNCTLRCAQEWCAGIMPRAKAVDRSAHRRRGEKTVKGKKKKKKKKKRRRRRRTIQ
jgi:hypothetical protein